MASDLSMGNGLWTLVGCCIFVGFTFAWHKVRRWGAAAMHDGVECQTMANHKGGVGKTTVSLLLAKQLAADPAQNVLVVDCSLYGDISRLLLGDAGARVARGDADHIEGLTARLTRTGLCGRLWRSYPKVEQFVRRVEGAAHGNLFVLTSKAQCSNSILGTEECMAGLGAPLVARSLRDMLARDVWGEASRATPIDNVIDVHVTRLRKKIDRDHQKPLIHTLRGIGFQLSEVAP